MHTIAAAMKAATPGKGMRQEQLHLLHFNVVSHLLPDTPGAETPALSCQQLGAPVSALVWQVLLLAITIPSWALLYSVKSKPRTSDSDRHTPLNLDRNVGSTQKDELR